jgi:hypothetical protein
MLIAMSSIWIERPEIVTGAIAKDSLTDHQLPCMRAVDPESRLRRGDRDL